MTTPKISVLLCTVRDEQGAYTAHPEWGCVEKVLRDLDKQTFRDFEVVIVDGVTSRCPKRTQYNLGFNGTPGPRVKHLPPTQRSPWVRGKHVAICAYRNTGIAAATGELIVNLDDCCELPPEFLRAFWHCWSNHRTCLAMRWPENGDTRAQGVVTQPGMVYGFGSYPLRAALQLNGYNEAFDGGQGLEDGEWSTRLFRHGVRMMLAAIPGFRLHDQSGHSTEAIGTRPIVKCCNQAWHASQVQRQLQVANRAEDWPRAWTRQLIGPCHLYSDGICLHHPGGHTKCAFPMLATQADSVAVQVLNEPPVLDLFDEWVTQNSER